MNENNLLSNGKYLFILYLIISSNYLSNLIGCRVQDMIKHNFFVKHLLGFMTLFFFITLADTNNKLSLKKKFVISLFIYSIFILSIKIHFKAWLIMMLSLGTIYMVDIFRDNFNEKEKIKYNKMLSNIQKISAYIAGISLILGLLYQIGEQKNEYGDKFNYNKFFFLNPICKKEEITYDIKYKGNFIETIKKAFL